MYDDGGFYERNENTKDSFCTTANDLDTIPPYVHYGGIPNMIAYGFDLDQNVNFDCAGYFSTVFCRFPGVNLVMNRANGGKASFPQTRNQWAPAGFTTGGLDLGENYNPNDTEDEERWASIWAHELGHSLGLSHSFGNGRRAQTRIGHIAPLYTDNAESSNKKVDYFGNTTNGFTPPFEYVAEDGSIQDYETIDATETQYIENMINQGARDATSVFTKRLEFDRGNVTTPMSVTNGHLGGEDAGEGFTIYLAALKRFSSFWGGSYITHSDGTKEMVVNPTTTVLRDAENPMDFESIPNLATLSGSGSLPSHGMEYDDYWFVYDITYKTIGVNIFCDVKFISKYNKQKKKLQLISDNTPALQYSGDALAETQTRYITAQSGEAIGSFPNPDGGFPDGCAVSVAASSDATAQDFYYIGYRNEYEQAKDRLINSDVDWGFNYSLYNNYFAHSDSDTRVWTLTKDIPSGGTGTNVKVQLAALHTDANFSSSEPSDKRYWYLNDNHPGSGATSGDGLSANDVYAVPLRKKTFVVTEQSMLDQINSSGLLDINFIPVEVFDNRKGPQITTYVPFCKIEEQTDPDTGVTSFVQTNEFDPFWYANLNWLNPNYPKYPDNWPVSKLYDAVDADGNPLCPCLHTVQHYYYEAPGAYYTDSATGDVVIPFTNNLVEYIPINAKTEDLVYQDGSNVINSQSVMQSHNYEGGWNYYGAIPENNGTDAYKLNMLYNYLDYKWNLNTNSSYYGGLMTNRFNDDDSNDYFNSQHFFGTADGSTYCGKQMRHNSSMEVYVNTLEFDNFYPSVRRYGSRVHSWPHCHGIFFEHHILEHNCPGGNCDSPKIEVPYWGYTGIFGQCGVPKELKLNTYGFADLAPTYYENSMYGGHTSFANVVLNGYQLNTDGIDDTGRDMNMTAPTYVDRFNNYKGGSNNYFYSGGNLTGMHDCGNQVTYDYNQFYFSADITLRYFFGSSDPNAAVYNPYRPTNTSSSDLRYHYKVNSAERIILNGSPAISCNIERGLTHNIMAYWYNNSFRSHPDNPLTALEMPNSASTMSSPRNVFSPDQLARMESIVESRFSYLNKAMEYADEIDLRNAVYASTSETDALFAQAKTMIDNQFPNQNFNSINPSQLIILGNVASVDMTGATVYNVCLDKSPTICNGYEAFVAANTSPSTGPGSTLQQILGLQQGGPAGGNPLDAFIPDEPGTYGPALQVGNDEIIVIYWDQSLCCGGSWDNSESTCLIGDVATLDCTGCAGGNYLDNTNPYQFVLESNPTFPVTSGIGLPLAQADIYEEGSIIAEEVFVYNNSYYLYSNNPDEIVQLRYEEVSSENILNMQKFNKVKGILNKMSNFAK